MVKGYEFYNSDDCTCCGMQEHESHMNLGADYVLAYDYAALEAERDDLKRKLDAVEDECFCAREICARTILTIVETDEILTREQEKQIDEGYRLVANPYPELHDEGCC